MYIERKTINREAFIGRVTFSKSGRTLYYRDKAFASIGDSHWAAGNYHGYNKEAFIADQNLPAEERRGLPYSVYWISGPKKDGTDRLFGKIPIINIDEDVREEYWLTIRNQPENINKRFY
jgi:hypothetical protein